MNVPLDERMKAVHAMGRLLTPRLKILGEIHGNGKSWRFAVKGNDTLLSCPDCDAVMVIEDMPFSHLVMTGLFPFDFIGGQEKCKGKEGEKK